MKRFYSAETNGFYLDDDFQLYTEAGTLPTDLIEITNELFESCMSAPDNDSHIEPDANGMPSIVKDVKTTAQIQSAADGQISGLLSLASSKISPLQDAVDLGIATDIETASLAAWKTYRVAVNRVPTQSGYPTTIDWPPMPE